MSHHIDPDVMYRIRSRGVERPAVEGYRLPQLVRDFVLARHDELSEDGELWFPASEVESLFPSAANARLIRERQSRDPGEQAQDYPTQIEDDRKFPREPWYVARASNVAGPYDQLTITQWYEEGCLRDNDQLRPGMHAKWRTLAVASSDGLLAPPPANTCSVNPIHLVADPPVWMGPPTTRATVTEEWTPATRQSEKFDSNLPLILASVGAFVLFLASLAGFAWFALNTNRQNSDPAGSSERVTSRAGQTVAGSMPASNAAGSIPERTVDRSISASNQVEKAPKIKSAIPIKRPIAIRLQTSALTSTLDKQTIHRGSGVYEISLLKVPDVKRSIEFEISEPDDAGARDLIAAASTGERRRMGTIYTEPDRVMFAWSPAASHNVAAAFVLTHEILIRDETHHNTIQFQFASPATLPTPPTPFAREFDLPIPDWVPPEFELLLKPTFVSIAPDEQIAFDPFAVVAPGPKSKTFEKNVDLTSLQDESVKSAKFLVEGDIVGSGNDRKVRFSSTVVFTGTGKAFDWSERTQEIREQAANFNEQERKNKKPFERRPMNAADRLKVIEDWADLLSCQLELYVRVNDREILCGKTQ